MNSSRLHELEKQVQESMLLLSPGLSEAYDSAVEIVPEVVQQETRIADFLDRENGDPLQAATRLARYWKLRRALFGNRWLLAMTQTASGALDPREVEVLRSGFIKIVHSEVHGVVYIVDPVLLPKSSFSQNQPQVHFYLATILSCEVTVLFLVRSGERPRIIVHNHCKDLLESTLLRVKDVLIVQAHEEGREHLLDYLGFEQQRVAETNLNISSLENNYIVGQSMDQTLRLLEDRGFDKNTLPTEVGGTVDMSTFNDWVRMRLSIEDSTSAEAITRNLMGRVAQSVLSTTSQDQALVLPADSTQQRGSLYPVLVQRQGESDKDFQKRKNASYVRRNYHRQRLSVLVLEGETEQCQRLNNILKAENQKLQDLLAQAEELVSNLDKKPPAHESSNEQVTEVTNLPVDDNDDNDDDDVKDDTSSSSFASVLVEATEAAIEVVEEEQEDEEAKAET
eukprot:scaffold4278_cov173-Amphora_coffeaeformis.AAC.1